MIDRTCCSRSSRRSASLSEISLNLSGLMCRKARSSSSHLICQMPNRFASGANTSSVCWAIRSRSASGSAPRVRILCKCSASFTTTIRTSSPMDKKSLRAASLFCSVRRPSVGRSVLAGCSKLTITTSICSRCWSARVMLGMVVNRLTPSTNSPISSPNSRRISAEVDLVSRGTSCNNPAAIMVGLTRNSARMTAVARQCEL